MIPYALAIFTGAFLLFQVQPIIAKMILPWFGGSAAVWTTCMLFFQLVLLAGYLYSHKLVGGLSPARQGTLHLILLAVSLLWLPMSAAVSLKPAGGEEPISRILMTLAASVGLPYFLLSTTGPLLQAWYAREFQGAIPYRLFALSNLASLLALVAYPFAIEPLVSTAWQGRIWSIGYLVFVGLTGWLAYQARQWKDVEQEAESAEPAEAPTLNEKLLWVALAAFPSVFLLAVSNHLTQNVASIPFLWIVPLVIYLLSFVLTFDSDRFYDSQVFLWVLFAALAAAAFTFYPALLLGPLAKMGVAWAEHFEVNENNIKLVIGLYSLGLFIICMWCHGELARRKPAPRHLTSFYLMLSVGGALGGLLVSFVAPLTLPGYYELPAAVAVLALFVVMMLVGGESFVTTTAWTALAVIVVWACVQNVRAELKEGYLNRRNFYGSLKVRNSDEGGEQIRGLIHGVINHGEQFMEGAKKTRPVTYYGPLSGVGLAMTHTRTPDNPHLNVAVIGLGIGTMSSWTQAGDRLRFYEINPQVLEIARSEFTYLKDAPGQIDIALGDARLTLEREAPRGYDVIAVDAFSSDSIPVHLLTREALQVYLKHLKPTGVAAIHVSNKHLELEPVVRRGAVDLGLKVIAVENEPDDENYIFESDWVLVTRNEGFANLPVIRNHERPKKLDTKLRLWTDDYSNLFQIVK